MQQTAAPLLCLLFALLWLLLANLLLIKAACISPAEAVLGMAWRAHIGDRFF
jgi:hypothetical protein